MDRKPRNPSAPKAKKADSRSITVRTPFNYYWPGTNAVTHYHTPGEYRAKNEVADFAVKNGYATEGKNGEQSPGETANSGTIAPVGDENAADDDRPADRPAVDSDAG